MLDLPTPVIRITWILHAPPRANSGNDDASVQRAEYLHAARGVASAKLSRPASGTIGLQQLKFHESTTNGRVVTAAIPTAMGVGDPPPVGSSSSDAAAAPTQWQIGAFPAHLGQPTTGGVLLTIAKTAKQRALPDRVPGVSQEIASRHVIGLTRQNVAIGLDADEYSPASQRLAPMSSSTGDSRQYCVGVYHRKRIPRFRAVSRIWINRAGISCSGMAMEFSKPPPE